MEVPYARTTTPPPHRRHREPSAQLRQRATVSTRSAPAVSRRSHRRGETLLRQGLLNPAIAEFLAAVEADPGDWLAAGRLGDLFVRAGNVERAVEQYARVGDAFHSRGMLPLAASAYTRILRLTPEAVPVRLKV